MANFNTGASASIGNNGRVLLADSYVPDEPPPFEYTTSEPTYATKEEYQRAQARGETEAQATSPAPTWRPAASSVPLPPGRMAVDVEVEGKVHPGIKIDGEDLPRRVYKVLTRADLDTLPNLRWLIKPYLVRDTLAIISGEPGAMKSVVGVKWACELAQRGLCVLYIAYEGGTGLKWRFHAWELEHNSGQPVEVYTLAEAGGLVQGDDVEILIDTATAALPRKPDLIVVDTLARAATGAEENSNTEMGGVIDNCDALRRATGACVLLVHHVSKMSGRSRGASAISGAVFTELELSKDEKTAVITLHTKKQKDVAQAPDAFFAWHRVTWFDPSYSPDDEDAIEPASVVLDETDAPETGGGLSAAKLDVLQTIATLSAEGASASNEAIAALMDKSRQSVSNICAGLRKACLIEQTAARAPYQITPTGRKLLGIDARAQ